ncbi:MAG: ROK family transcriptional regulator [Spirochaetes bacterium]|nr:ROK family transcriptional regulator [Spirochaetota bacterium]
MQLSSKEVLLLQALHFLDSPTRNEIARYTGLSAVSVTSLLNALLEAGAIQKVGKAISRGGRPSVLYKVSPDFGFTVGISVESSAFRVVAIDSGMEILEERQYALALSSQPQDHLTEIVRKVSTELERLLTADSLAERRLLALGIAPPGMVDTAKGMWLHGMRVSGIAHIDLRDLLGRTFSVPVVAEDPARCIAWHERARAGGSAAEPMVLLYLGDGVGAGILIDGGLYRGANGLAGEIGHLHVAEDGDRCPCGNVGCLEMIVSEPSILRRFHRRLGEGVISALQRFAVEGLDLARILEAAGADDRLARSTLYDLGLVVGDACATLVELYNPRTLLVGGPVSALWEFLREPVSLRVKQRVIPEMLGDLRIDRAPYAPHDEAMGAAMIAERHFWERLDPSAARRLASPSAVRGGAGGEADKA